MKRIFALFLMISVLFSVLSSCSLSDSSSLSMSSEQSFYPGLSKESTPIPVITAEPPPTLRPRPEPTPEPTVPFESSYGSAPEIREWNSETVYSCSTYEESLALIYCASQERLSQVHFTLPSDALSEEQRNRFATNLVNAAPLLVFLTYEWISSGTDLISYSVNMTYRPGVVIADAWQNQRTDLLTEEENALFETALEILDTLSVSSLTEIEKELRIENYLCSHIEYAAMTDDLSDIQDVTTAFSALQEGKANCQGYSDAFYLLATLSGLKTDFDYGFLDEEDHVWNRIFLNGEWYAVDVTSDDSSSQFDNSDLHCYMYFNMGANQLTDFGYEWNSPMGAPYSDNADTSYYTLFGHHYDSLEEFSSSDIHLDEPIYFSVPSPVDFDVMEEIISNQIPAGTGFQYAYWLSKTTTYLVVTES